MGNLWPRGKLVDNYKSSLTRVKSGIGVYTDQTCGD